MIKALALAGLAAVANAGAVELTGKNFEESIAGAPPPPCRSQRICVATLGTAAGAAGKPLTWAECAQARARSLSSSPLGEATANR